MSIEAITKAHLYDYPDSFCDCGVYVGVDPATDWPAHLAEVIRAHLLSPAVIARAGLTIWPDATHPDDRAWAEADARAAITAALGVGL